MNQASFNRVTCQQNRIDFIIVMQHPFLPLLIAAFKAKHLDITIFCAQ